MATQTTTYDIQVRMKMANDIRKASSAMDQLSRSARSVSRIVKAGALGFGLGSALKSAISYNSALEETQIRLTAMFQGNLGGTFADNQRRAAGFMKQMRMDAEATPGTFQDMVGFSQEIAGHVTRAGGSMEDLRKITKGGVVAAAVFGEEAGLAARDIQQALSGTLGSKDRFAKQLLGPMKMTAVEWNRIVKTNPNKGVEMLINAFDQKHIKDASKAYQNSFKGVSSTLRSQLMDVLGMATGPLTEELKKEMQKASAWLKNNKETVKNFARSVGKTLVKAFRLVKSAMQFLYRNRDTLITLTKALLAFKMIKAGTGAMMTFAGALGASTAGLARFANALGVAGAAVVAAWDQVKKGRADVDKKVKVADEFHFVRQQFQRGGGFLDKEAQVHLLQKLRKVGVLEESGQINEAQLAKKIVDISGSRTVGGKEMSDNPIFVKSMVDAIRFAHKDALHLMQERDKRKEEERARLDQGVKMPATVMKPQVSVGKVVIEVASDDPDRFAMGLETMFNDLTNNPTQAINAFKES